MQTLQIGWVMRRSLSITGALILPLLAIALLAHAPRIAVALVVDAGESPGLHSTIEFQLLDLVMAQLLGAAVAYAAILEQRGTRVGLLQIMHVILSRMFPVVAVGLVTQLTVVLMNLQPLFGLLGVWVTTVLFVAVPIVVVEQPGIIESLRRSARLTLGRRWNILALLGIFVVITLAVDQILQVLFGTQGEILDPGYVAALSVFHASLAVFGSVVAAVSYCELRRLHENAGTRSPTKSFTGTFTGGL